MDPLTLAIAAGAYVAAEVAKKSADSVAAAAYKRVESYVVGRLSRAVGWGQVNATVLQEAGLAADPVVAQFSAEVLARTPALRRAQLVSTLVKGARILWVDDWPENNQSECQLLATLGADVRQVVSTHDALVALATGDWDLVLSDLSRGREADAGLQMLRQLPPGSPPVVFYVGQVDDSRPTPRGAFGMADRPGQLLHLVLDVVERHRV